jgi:RNA polymerase sigma-70 factor (ECF subfamily)
VRERASIELFDEVSGGETVERTVLARQELERVRQALAELPEKTRRAFVLHVIDGLPTPEVARLMGLKERMVRLHVSRALTRCKESLNGERS